MECINSGYQKENNILIRVNYYKLIRKKYYRFLVLINLDIDLVQTIDG